MTKNTLKIIGIILGVIIIFFFTLFPILLDRFTNRVNGKPLPPPSARARALVKKIFIADLHCDALLWNRDLRERNSRGHVDIPRLIEGGTALQTFSVVSKAPLGMMGYGDNVSDSCDLETMGLIAQRWPPRTWSSLRERALYQSERMRAYSRTPGGRCALITSVESLDRYLERRAHDRAITAALLSVEGAQVLEGDTGNIEVLFRAGFRMMSPTHFFDNDMGGSAHGVKKYGLTQKGKTMIRLMEAKGMIVDLAHASPDTIDDVLAMAARPVVVSHTGVRGVCPGVRNISDRHIRMIAEKGGLIGIGYFPKATCGETLESVVRSIRYAVDRAGVRHVGLGSDYDGLVQVPFDTTGMASLADALLDNGFTEDEVSLIMGGNVLRLLRETLPLHDGTR
ncbi:MAG TPA: dipeptidase [Spirochaetota bacterium]|nr:dipeptidase [Spirochaetota bacterium]HPV41228.1 dipeptidase [Spirochaetota bacterium]